MVQENTGIMSTNPLITEVPDVSTARRKSFPIPKAPTPTGARSGLTFLWPHRDIERSRTRGHISRGPGRRKDRARRRVTGQPVKIAQWGKGRKAGGI